MFKALGYVFMTVGYLIYLVGGFCSLVLDIQWINYIYGFWGVIVGFTILPVAFIVAPFYAGFAFGYWLPLKWMLISMIGGSIFFGIGSKISHLDT